MLTCSKSTLIFIRQICNISDKLLTIEELGNINIEKKEKIYSDINFLIVKRDKLTKDQYLLPNCNLSRFNFIKNSETEFSERKSFENYSKTELKLAKIMLIFDDYQFMEFLKLNEISFENIQNIITLINKLLTDERIDINYLESNKQIINYIKNNLNNMIKYFGYGNLEMFLNKTLQLYIYNYDEIKKALKTKRK